MSEGLLNADTDTAVDNPVETKDWKESLSKDVLTHVERFKTTDELAKGYAELNTALGTRVKIPDDKTTPEELQKFYGKLGRPETADKYAFDKPALPDGMEYDQNLEGKFREIAHSAGLNQKQAKQLYDGFNNYQLDVFNSIQKQITKELEEGEKKLKEEWKADFDKNAQIADRAFGELATEDFKAFINDANLKSDPAVVKFFYELGLKMLDDTLVKGTQAPKPEYVPAYPNSPGMYKNMAGEEGEKAREYFRTVKNYKYD